MKVSRKIKAEKALKGPENGDEIPPTLYLSGLGKAIAGLGDKGDFAAHIKGKVRGHTVRHHGDGKQEHSYDLDVHDFEPHSGSSGAVKRHKSSSEEVAEAMDKYEKEDKEKAEKKGKANG
jgi:hypothetical protein